MPHPFHTLLLVGSGAREHALAKAIKRSSRPHSLVTFASSTNPGMADLSQTFARGNINDPEAVTACARDRGVTLAVVGPEAPLEAGVADALWEEGIPVVGPRKDLAMIETSKGFARGLMTEFGIPGCPAYRHFRTMQGVEDFLQTLSDKFVVKADGLMGGKGVKVAGDHLHSHREALQYCQQLIAKGASFVIEEKCLGEEFSMFSFCDGRSLRHMPPIQDHKRAYEGDKGPNTGGMGSYSDRDHCLPFLKRSDIEAAQATNALVAKALRKKTGQGYQGILYGGYMATADGVRVIEFNARFGDPEAMNLLTLLETDIIDIFEAIGNETLRHIKVSFAPKASVCKYAVPDGYPDNPAKGFAVGIERVEQPENLFLGAVDLQNGQLVATGSRTAAVVGVAEELAEAEAIAEKLVSQVEGNLFHRQDVGRRELIEQRVAHMRSLRN